MKKRTPKEINDHKDEEVIRKTTPKDYSGEAHFRELSPKQKLDWLSQAAEFVYKYILLTL